MRVKALQQNPNEKIWTNKSAIRRKAVEMIKANSKGNLQLEEKQR